MNQSPVSVRCLSYGANFPDADFGVASSEIRPGPTSELLVIQEESPAA